MIGIVVSGIGRLTSLDSEISYLDNPLRIAKVEDDVKWQLLVAIPISSSPLTELTRHLEFAASAENREGRCAWDVRMGCLA